MYLIDWKELQMGNFILVHLILFILFCLFISRFICFFLINGNIHNVFSQPFVQCHLVAILKHCSIKHRTDISDHQICDCDGLLLFFFFNYVHNLVITPFPLYT